MDINNLKFPILCFSQNLVNIRQSEAKLTTCMKGALKNGYFENLLLVDSTGYAIKIKNAYKLHGVGPFWGYDIFLDRRIKVELIFNGEPFTISVDEVRRYVLESFKKWHGWATRGDFKELVRSIHKAQSIWEIIEILKN